MQGFPTVRLVRMEVLTFRACVRVRSMEWSRQLENAALYVNHLSDLKEDPQLRSIYTVCRCLSCSQEQNLLGFRF